MRIPVICPGVRITRDMIELVSFQYYTWPDPLARKEALEVLNVQRQRGVLQLALGAGMYFLLAWTKWRRPVYSPLRSQCAST